MAGDDRVTGKVFALRDGGPSCKGRDPWRAFDRVIFGEISHRIDFAPTVGHAWGQITVRRATHNLIAAVGLVHRGNGGTGLAWRATIATEGTLNHSGATRAVLLHHDHHWPLTP